MNNSPFTTHGKGISSGAKAKTKKMPQEETRGSTSHVEPPKKGRRGRKPDPVKKAQRELEEVLKKEEKQRRKKERAEYKKKMREYAKEYNRMQRAISKVERKDYENWWKQNTKTTKQLDKAKQKAIKDQLQRQEKLREKANARAERKAYEIWWKQTIKSENQKAREAAKKIRDSIKQQDKEAAKIQKEIDKATKQEALKEAKKRDQAARKAELDQFRTFLKDIKRNMKTWATKDNLSQEALNAVLKQIPGVKLTDKGSISAAKSDRRNDEMKQALKNMLKDSKSFSKALQNSPFWNTDRKRLLWYRIFVDTFDKDKLSPLKWGSLGYQEIVEKWDELEFAVIQDNLILATQLMDELDQLMNEVQRKIDAGNVTEDYNYDDDYNNF